jgi:type I restriction enzyme S subunit
MEKQKNIPRLRFPEYSGDWEDKKLGDIAKFSKGKGISKSDISNDGINECIRYGELYTRYGEVVKEIYSRTNIEVNKSVVSEANDVIIPASGETQIDIATASCVIKSGIILGGDLNIIKTVNNGIFLSYYLNNKKKQDIANLAQGISVVHLYSSQLALLNLNLPEIEEQTKIASFISKVDEKLSALKKKKELLEQYKKGVMKQIFSQELRFKDDGGNDFPDWEENTMGEIAKFYSGGTPLTTKRQYFGGEIPFIRSGEINSNKTEQYITDEGLKNSSAKLVEIGDILYALYGATSGEVGISKINGAINQAVLCIRSLENHFYIYSFLKYEKENIIKTYLQGGQGNLSADIVKKIKIPIPNKKEQTKIADFLSTIDNKIAYCQSQIEKAEVWKKGLLQQMFC